MKLKTIFVLIWVYMWCFVVVKGSCLEYGHSCWGAHGKRSGSGQIFRNDLNLLIEKMDSENFIDAVKDDNLSDKLFLDEAQKSISLPVETTTLTYDNQNAFPLQQQYHIKRLLLKKFYDNEKAQRPVRGGQSRHKVIKIKTPDFYERWRQISAPLYQRSQLSNMTENEYKWNLNTHKYHTLK